MHDNRLVRLIAGSLTAGSLASLTLALAQLPQPPAPSIEAAPVVDPIRLDERIIGSVLDFPLPNLADGLVVQLEIPQQFGAPLTIAVPMLELKTVHLELQPDSVRAPGYQLRVQQADGSWETPEPGPEKVFGGRLREFPEAEIAASILEEGLLAAVFLPDGETYWVQPLTDFVPGAEPGAHVVYRGADSRCEGACGSTDAQRIWDGAEGGTRGSCGGSRCVAQIACDSDVEYFVNRGSNAFNVEDRISATVYVVNHLYQNEVAITHGIQTILVRTAEPDPYSSTNPNTLLNQMTNEWNNNQTGIQRDLVHLFTGKDLDDPVIGIAWIGVVCNNVTDYGLSWTDFSTNFACQADLVAHEMGHEWGSDHCDLPAPEFCSTCASTTMNSSITCANTFCTSSRGRIDTYADTLGCLLGGPVLPANDMCNFATVVMNDGSHSGSNVGASTDGSQTFCGPRGGGFNDIWWRYSPPVTGTVTIDTCGAAIDTVLSIHTGCPGTPANMVSCDDNCPAGFFCAGSDDSCLSFTATAGQFYYIRATTAVLGTVGNLPIFVDGPTSPSANACGSAITVVDGASITGSLYDMTNDGTTNCTPLANKDVWYQFTAPCSGTLTVDTCGSNDFPAVDMGMDTMVSLHTGCPGTIVNQITCNDDFGGCPGASGSNFDSRVQASLIAGQNVKIRVSHFGSSYNNGFFNLHVDFTTTPTTPVINAIADASRNCGAGAYTGPTPTLTTPTCMAPATWSLVAGPAFMTINASTGVVTWPIPTVGAHTLTIRATNSAGFDEETWLLTVNRIAPVVSPIADQVADCSLVYGGPVPSVTSASCMNPITWSLVTAPAGMTINAATGQVSWSGPVIGTHPVTIRATNSAGFDDEAFNVTINRIAPIINGIPDASHNCGGAYSGPTPTLVIAGCMNPITAWTLIAGPAGMTINAATGVVSWPTPVIAGSPHTITIRGTNSAGFDDESWALTVSRLAPVVNDIPNGSHNCGGAYTGPTPALFNPACMNPITAWSLQAGPAGMTISAATGVVSWPTPTVVGSPHTITIRATNSAGLDDETWTLTVNRLAPVVNDIPNASHTCGSAYTGPTPALSNPTCMNPITAWSLQAGPAGMTINAATGVVSWPTPTIAGSPHTITIRGTNSAGFDDETWTLTVNRLAPVINNIPDATIPAAVAYTGPTPTLTNPACMNPITAWSLITGPAGMTINAATGVVSWPSPTAVGSPHTVTIRATNSAASDDETWSLTVTGGGCANPGCDSGGLDADLDDDCEITLSDLAIELSAFGSAGPVGDIDGNGMVELADLAVLLSRFGNICH